MSFQFKNTEAYLTNYVKRLIEVTKRDIDKPRNRIYKKKQGGTRMINAPLNATGSLKNSLILKKKMKSLFNERGFRTTQSFRIVGNSYGEILDEGADGSKVKATTAGIENWINSKPVNLTYIKDKTKVAQLIKEKLDREGIKGIGFLQQIVDEQFSKVFGIENSLMKDVDLNLEDILITLGYNKKGEIFTSPIK